MVRSSRIAVGDHALTSQRLGLILGRETGYVMSMKDSIRSHHGGLTEGFIGTDHAVPAHDLPLMLNT